MQIVSSRGRLTQPNAFQNFMAYRDKGIADKQMAEAMAQQKQDAANENAFNKILYGGGDAAWRTPGINPNAPTPGTQGTPGTNAFAMPQQNTADARQFAIDNNMWEQVKGLDAAQQERVGQTYLAFAQIAQSAKALPPEQRAEYAQYILQQQGIDPSVLGQVPGWDDASMDAISRSSIDVAEQLNQVMKERAQTETERSNLVDEANTQYSNQTGRMNAITNRQNADTNRGELGLAQQQFAARQDADRVSGADGLYAARNEIASRADRTKLILSTIDKAIKQSDSGILGTGIAGNTGYNAIASGVPGSRSKNLKSTIDTIQANIGFEELQRMRDNSPTGGALGQVTEKEIAFLQSVLGSLDLGQSEKQLDQNLSNARREIAASFERIAAAYEQDYGVRWDGWSPNAQQQGADQSGGQQSEVYRLNSPNDYYKIPSGAQYYDTEGNLRQKR